MMLLSALVSLPLLTVSSPFARRQSGTPIEYIDEQIRQVRAAIYAAQVIEAGNAIEVCGQAEAETEPPYDTELARTLICEAAVGIDVFSESSDAVSDLTLARAGLERLAGSSNSPAENLPCNDPPIMPLNEAGLDGPGIWTLICTPFTSATASTSTPTSGLEGNESQDGQTMSTLSQSATMPGTTLSVTEASATSAAPIESLTTSSTFTSPVLLRTSNSTMRSSNPTILTTVSVSSTELTSGVGLTSSETVSDNPIGTSTSSFRPPAVTTLQNSSAEDPLSTSGPPLFSSISTASPGAPITTNFSSPSPQVSSLMNVSSSAVPASVSLGAFLPSWVVGSPLSFPLPTSSISTELMTITKNTTLMPTRSSETISVGTVSHTSLAGTGCGRPDSATGAVGWGWWRRPSHHHKPEGGPDWRNRSLTDDQGNADHRHRPFGWDFHG
ncbi:hypothetical protein KC343_g636 [Hortaea werneckii]|nr:hypothetical protein KC323_g8077 [Hortaea werneckii]KAI7285712.1 hypothetical protein KC352_g5140 [Hortaea werneckii]KAI7346206.1 hypothetical protein KC320_g7999 [Hortaea werneckii]KAI7572227.1 hypothetical protein KC317_g949 [Hortaea werneckii]KAI7627275.1 hypothetical protein KC346_g826 [Hortaea werneckii]